jgi:Flp pilus assembly protein TadB
MIAAAVLCALGFGFGIVGVVSACTQREHERGQSSMPAPSPKQLGLSASAGGMLRRVLGRHGALRLALACAVGAVATVVTRWPVAFPIVVVATLGLPSLFGQTSTALSVSKLEAIATWTEMLHSTLAASAGLNQAIMATAPMSPDPIRPATLALAGRLRAGMYSKDAMVLFAEEVADPSADRVVCALILASSARAQHLGDLLGTLADSTREDVALRLRIETSRASPRSGIRTVIVFSVAFAAALALLAHSYLVPFGTPTGQVILVAIGALYTAGLWLMVRMAKPPAPVRLLTYEETK